MSANLRLRCVVSAVTADGFEAHIYDDDRIPIGWLEMDRRQAKGNELFVGRVFEATDAGLVWPEVERWTEAEVVAIGKEAAELEARFGMSMPEVRCEDRASRDASS